MWLWYHISRIFEVDHVAIKSMILPKKYEAKFIYISSSCQWWTSSWAWCSTQRPGKLSVSVARVGLLIITFRVSWDFKNILPTWRIIQLLNPVHFVASKIGWKNKFPKGKKWINLANIICLEDFGTFQGNSKEQSFGVSE